MNASRGRGLTSERRRARFFEVWAWTRAVLAVVARPRLWATAARQVARMARPRWWAHAPFLPLPDAGYVRFRLETAYGDFVAPAPDDLVSYLEWCRSR